MNPTRWQEIERVYHAALERPPTTRDEFLMEVCKNDSELRREVQSLLANDTSKTGKLDQPAWVGLDGLTALDASLTVMNPGTCLGPYRIEGPLGKGGMGEVFRAVDTRLGRSVAVKVCARQFGGRFEREARAISTLNHPHICTLYDVGPNYLVMELVEGDTLVARLKKGPLPMELVLRFDAEIADALAAAHAHGIIHRDLKPGNIMIAKTGVKVLDFGLAKSQQDRTLTATGVVMGTPAYMPPEQIEGKECDARSDIYALGLVLYEMATGKRAMQPLEGVPERLAPVIERCLARDPDDRWHAAKDVKTVLEWAAQKEPAAQRKIPTRGAIAAGLIVLGLAFGWVIAHQRQPAPEMRSLRLEITPPAGAEFSPDSGAAISPDGHVLAFVARSANGDKLWLRPLDSLTARELPGTDGATFPFWSPDSGSLAFFAAGKLKRIDVSGGLPTVICEVGTGRGGTWNADGIILFNSVNNGPLLKVSATGGTPASVTNVDTAQFENSHRWPQFLPGGRRFLYFIRSEPAAAQFGVYLGSLDEPQKIRLFNSTSNAIYAPDGNGGSGHLLWVRDGTLMTQPFDPEKGQLLMEAAMVAEGVAFGEATRLGAVSVSNDGTLFYGGVAQQRRQLTWYNREGKVMGVLGQPEASVDLRISPDGKRVAFVRDHNVWQIEFARGIPTRVGSGELTAVWSADSTRVSYMKGYPPNIFAQSIDSTSPDERLTESRDSQIPLDWSPDGRFLLYSGDSNDVSSKLQRDLWLLPVTGDRKPIRLTQTPYREGRSRFSPDGKWIAYTSDESGRNEIYVQSFPASGPKWQVSSTGGDYPLWRKDAGELFYVTPDRNVMSVAVRVSSRGLEFGTPNNLFSVPVLGDQSLAYTYDVMPDGERFLVVAPLGDAPASAMTVVTNWRAELPAAKK